MNARRPPDLDLATVAILPSSIAPKALSGKGALAGMLHKCGLLGRDAGNLVEYAAKVYNTEGNEATAAEFRKAFGRDCPVHFVGVWDTVESLVMNAGKRFHDGTLNPEVTHGYHALAIDERRKDFPPSLWDETAVQPGQKCRSPKSAGRR